MWLRHCVHDPCRSLGSKFFDTSGHFGHLRKKVSNVKKWVGHKGGKVVFPWTYTTECDWDTVSPTRVEVWGQQILTHRVISEEVTPPKKISNVKKWDGHKGGKVVFPWTCVFLKVKMSFYKNTRNFPWPMKTMIFTLIFFKSSILINFVKKYPPSGEPPTGSHLRRCACLRRPGTPE